jgi:hypothetical protein
MKAAERERARTLRLEGMSINDILKRVPAAKSSISTWVRDIELTEEQIAAMASKSAAARERTIQTKRIKREARIGGWFREAEQEYEVLSQNVRFMFGLALYIGEGSKRKEAALEISNCDPGVIRKAILFFEDIGIKRAKMRCRINLHPHLPEEEVLAYWRGITGFNACQFWKVSRAVSSASQGKTFNRQPYGTCVIQACSTKTYYKLLRWMELALT